MGLALHAELPIEYEDIRVRLSQEFLELVVLGLQVAQLGRIGGLHAGKA